MSMGVEDSDRIGPKSKGEGGGGITSNLHS